MLNRSAGSTAPAVTVLRGVVPGEAPLVFRVADVLHVTSLGDAFQGTLGELSDCDGADCVNVRDRVGDIAPDLTEVTDRAPGCKAVVARIAASCAEPSDTAH